MQADNSVDLGTKLCAQIVDILSSDDRVQRCTTAGALSTNDTTAVLDWRLGKVGMWRIELQSYLLLYNSLARRKTQLRKGSPSVYSIHLYIILVTKYRRKIITTPMLARLQEIFTNVCSQQKSALIEFSGEENHVHLLVTIAPDTLISQLVASLKAASSRLMRKEFAEHVRNFYWKPLFWHNSYCVISCGGAPLEVIKQYIRGQEQPS